MKILIIMIEKIIAAFRKKPEHKNEKIFFPIKWIRSPNFSGRPTGDVHCIVLHWTGGSFRSCVNWFKNKKSRVSSHYVISIEGEIIQMVKESQKAWHAGKSNLAGYGSNVNNFSIGIELEGPPSSVDLVGWPAEQIAALINLCDQIKERYPYIKITDHSTISPGRKVDVKMGSGPNEFDWDSFIKNVDIPEA